jgi:hypothetical protein
MVLLGFGCLDKTTSVNGRRPKLIKRYVHMYIYIYIYNKTHIEKSVSGFGLVLIVRFCFALVGSAVCGSYDCVWIIYHL